MKEQKIVKMIQMVMDSQISKIRREREEKGVIDGHQQNDGEFPQTKTNRIHQDSMVVMDLPFVPMSLCNRID